MGIAEDALELHKGGKLSVASKVELSKEALSLAYTPGVAEVCRRIFENPDDVFNYTIKKNSVAVVSDGSAVLGMGNIGAEAAMPVMEGKCVLLKELVDVNAFPLCLRTQNPEEIIAVVRNIAPVFGGINLEDIAAPKCFSVEENLQDIGIPVIHDDQHASAIAIAAGMLNASSLVGKDIDELRIVVNGAGAAGLATAKFLLKSYHPEELIMCDSKGTIYKGRNDLKENKYKEEISLMTNGGGVSGGLADAMKHADAFVGLSRGNIVTKEMIRSMNRDSIIFAMANPVPEIYPGDAKEAGAAIVATGRSDFPNQVNNSLVFPGVFRGALDARAAAMNYEMKTAAVKALAGSIEPEEDNILPSTLDKSAHANVARAVEKAAKASGAVRKR
ncbi:MAG: NADP-dependent malic enzyme [Candidatus Aenigmarchaeota archaeon]|nr:NADP-dependent malic enzyme [Candidatus Aenigmarchaeota archaeon]